MIAPYSQVREFCDRTFLAPATILRSQTRRKPVAPPLAKRSQNLASSSSSTSSNSTTALTQLISIRKKRSTRVAHGVGREHSKLPS